MEYSLWLSNINGIGRKKISRLLVACSCAKEIYELPVSQMKKISGLSDKDVQNIQISREKWDLYGESEKLIREKIQFLSIEEKDFPSRLKQIPDPPYSIYVKGKLPEEKKKAAAIVGARKCSEYGYEISKKMATMLAQCNVNVVSGMAQGVDMAAHYGSINVNAPTFAVLGCGVNICYPSTGKVIYEQIQTVGGLISEYSPNVQPLAGFFPQRNRIISGLSDWIIIIEAKEKSGSLITADTALEQGKDVYAVPGRLTDQLSSGCNQLIHQGAGIVYSLEEFLKEQGLISLKEEKNSEVSKNKLEKEELLLYSCFDLYSKTLSELFELTNLPPAKVSSLLGGLQRKGLIIETFKNSYKKT